MTKIIGRHRPGSNTRSKFMRTAPETGGGNPPADNPPPPPANVTPAGTDFTPLIQRFDALPEQLASAVREAFPKAVPAENPPADKPADKPAEKPADSPPPPPAHPEPGKRTSDNDGRSKLHRLWFG